MLATRDHGARLDGGVPLAACLPSLCAVCRSWGRRGVCAACLDRLLARRVARRLKVAADAGLLLRLRETAHQLDLPPASRAGNVRDAFAVEPRRRAEIAGRRIAVVDDVLTTGSTASEIARVLKQAGAAHVDVWMLARTPRRDDT